MTRNFVPHKIVMVKSSVTFETDKFRCNLKCERCEHVKPDGNQCGNRVCIGTPLCWIHSRKFLGVGVKPSTIIDGKGLFAFKDFEEWDWICKYVGQTVTKKCVEDRYPGMDVAPYAVDSGRRVVDSACVRGIGSMANGKFGRNGKPRSVNAHNAQLERRKVGRRSEMWLRAIKQVKRGSEIFVWYGPEYELSEHKTYRTTRKDTRPC